MPRIQLKDIDIDIVLKDIKNVHLSVYPPDGKVRVSAPKGMKVDTIRVYVISKLAWIKKQQQKLRSQERQSPREMIERESHYYQGKRYMLEVVERQAKPAIELKHDYLVLYVRPGSSTSKRQEILNQWYRQQLKDKVTSLICKYEKISGVQVADFDIRKMKTRWGSCSFESKIIRINLELAKKPDECLEYIVVHEMMHLLEPSHNKRFISLMDHFMPKWQYYKDELNKLPVSHEEWKY
ncbi:MAG: M48 family metallopeptidase [Sedimentisphaerales bacterium]|nr:M48 family metallopeptidase [Sedimentisphaerales bacterium]